MAETQTAKATSRQPSYQFRLFTKSAQAFFMHEKSTRARVHIGKFIFEAGHLARAEKKGSHQKEASRLLQSTNDKLEVIISDLETRIKDLDAEIQLNRSLVSFKSVPVPEPTTYPMFSNLPVCHRAGRAIQLYDQCLIRVDQLFKTGCISRSMRETMKHNISKPLKRFFNDTHVASKPLITSLLADSKAENTTTAA